MESTSWTGNARLGVVALLLLSVVLAFPASVRGYQSTSDTSLAVLSTRDFIPTGEDLGNGWVIVEYGPVYEPIDGIRATEFSLYGGPAGSRAWVVVSEIASPSVEFDTAWNAVEEYWFESFTSLFFTPPSTERTTGFAETNLPGCAETITASTDYALDGFALGVTQCAVSSDFIVVTAVSGPLGPTAGRAASNRLTRESLGTAGIEAIPHHRFTDFGQPVCRPIVQFQGTNQELQSADVRTSGEATLADRPEVVHEALAELLPRMEVEITGEPVKDGVVTWYPVRWLRTGQEGYILSVFLEVCA